MNPRRKLTIPGLKTIFIQAYHDFVGKDVQQTTTYSYVWSADQAGHIMLGFVPSFLISWLILFFFSSLTLSEAMLYAVAIVMTYWTCLELYDFYDSARTAKKSKSPFPLNSGNLAWNVATALIYFSIGAFIAGSSIWGPGTALLTFLILGLLQFLVAIWWLRIKIIFQQAGLPYLYRLANYDGRFDESQVDKATQVASISAMTAVPKNYTSTDNDQISKEHLIIAGSIRSGKSSLAVGIATEFAFAKGIGRYVTMSELIQLFDHPAQPNLVTPKSRSSDRIDTDQQEFKDGRVLWQWPSVDLLIIDDVIEVMLAKHTDKPTISSDPVADFEKWIAQKYAPLLTILQKIPRIVWVIGTMIDVADFEQFVGQNFNNPPGTVSIRTVRLL